MKDLKDLKKIRLTLDEIKQFYKIDEYTELYELVTKLVNDNVLKPVPASKTNGMARQLYNKYALVANKDDNSEYISEIKNELYLGFDTSYYMAHIENYKNDRKYILQLSTFLKLHKSKLDFPASINERSFQIWGLEKFLKNENGKSIIKNLGMPIETLNFYYTPEPFVYHSFSKCPNQRVLIIENKDTWYSIRKLMIEGCNNILGIPIDTVLYGSGKRIEQSIFEYDLAVEDYLKNPKEVLYWGDIDYEGIGIYERLKSKIKTSLHISIFKPAYQKMLNMAVGIDLPPTKDGQNKNISRTFLNELVKEDASSIVAILESGKYIPQEIITYKELQSEV